MKTVVKQTMGRPSKYHPGLINKVDEYLETTGREQTHLPKIVSFARYIGVSKDSLYEWAKLHKDFSDALDKIMAAQEEELIDDGIFGGNEINSSIVKLMLMNNHGMREKTDTDLRVKELPKPLLNGVSSNDSPEETLRIKEEN